jgi:phosphomannomutase
LNHRVLTSFKAYDIRGRIGIDIDEDVAYRVGRAVAQHLSAKMIVVGYDARSTSADYAAAVGRGLCDAGADVLEIGMAGTEEMYWAVTEFGGCGGIEVTASHNPIDYNGMKIVKSGSLPLDDASDFQPIRALAEAGVWSHGLSLGRVINRSRDAREKYVTRVLSLVDVTALRPLKIVVNSGNGAAGPTFDVIASRLAEMGAPLGFVRVHHTPDPTFPNGIPNPLLPENQSVTSDVVKEVGADFGVAFDGDFDRCFLFDGDGQFVPGEYVVGLLAEAFLAKEPGSKVVHDPRVIWNTLDVVSRSGGTAIQSKTGHAFIKEAMRANQAVYGGEMSAHHYFRDFAYCDSGMLPWLLIAELLSKSGRSLADLLASRRAAFPSSGEVNFRVEDADAAITAVREAYAGGAELDEMDGLSISSFSWRLNVRKSNTEPLVRLNVETRSGVVNLDALVNQIAEAIQDVRS